MRRPKSKKLSKNDPESYLFDKAPPSVQALNKSAKRLDRQQKRAEWWAANNGSEQ